MYICILLAKKNENNVSMWARSFKKCVTQSTLCNILNYTFIRTNDQQDTKNSFSTVGNWRMDLDDD